jgi:hypothetical protein
MKKLGFGSYLVKSPSLTFGLRPDPPLIYLFDIFIATTLTGFDLTTGLLGGRQRRYHKTHRNLNTRTSMLVLVQQTFLAKKTLVKSMLIFTLDKVIYYKETFLQDSAKPLFTTQNRLKKKLFSTCVF